MTWRPEAVVTWRHALLWVLLPIGLWGFVRPLASAATRPSVGFASYYTAARLLVERAEFDRAWNDGWYGEQIRRFVPPVRDIWRPNPPSAALLVLPLAGLPYPAARVVWTGLSLLTLAAIWWWSVRELGLRSLGGLATLAGLLWFEPFRACLWYGQAYILMAGLLALGLRSLRNAISPAAGVAIGLLVGLKSAGLTLVPIFARGVGRRLLLPFVLTLAAVFGLTSVLVGLEPWQAYAGYLTRANVLFGRPEQTVTAYQNLLGLTSHLTMADPRWNPSPLFDLPAVGYALYLVLAVWIVAIGARRWIGARDLPLGMAQLALAHLILSPWTLDYHYPLAWPVAVVCLRQLRGTGVGAGIWMLSGAAGLLLLIPARWYDVPSLQAGLLALFAYPKLYGALLLFALCRERAPLSCPSR